MYRSYDYKGFTVEVGVEANFRSRSARMPPVPGYVAVVRIIKNGAPAATCSPIRFGDTVGRPFSTDVDALMGGYSAGRRIIDDLFSSGVQIH